MIIPPKVRALQENNCLRQCCEPRLEHLCSETQSTIFLKLSSQYKKLKCIKKLFILMKSMLCFVNIFSKTISMFEMEPLLCRVVAWYIALKIKEITDLLISTFFQQPFIERCYLPWGCCLPKVVARSERIEFLSLRYSLGNQTHEQMTKWLNCLNVLIEKKRRVMGLSLIKIFCRKRADRTYMHIYERRFIVRSGSHESPTMNYLHIIGAQIQWYSL